MKQYQITSRPRHLRYIFFIDENFSYDKLFELICLNQKLWGGRYNPIVPVRNNVISEQYINLISNYDPDYIYYCSDVDPEIIKKLRLFNPAGYFCLDKALFRDDILGVDASYLLPLFDRHHKVLFTQGLLTVNSPLLDFYKINFGLESNTLYHEFEIAKEYHKTIIGPDEFENLIGILQREHPITKSFLSRSNVLTTKLITKRTTKYKEFEIVVAKDKSTITDLIYYWNRLLYEIRNTFYITVEELNLLATDKYFGKLLYDLSEDDTINIVSMSLSKDEVENIIEKKFKLIESHRTFVYKDTSNFPFDILNTRFYEREYSETFKTQVLISEKGLFYLPKLSFTDKVGSFDQQWAVDVELLEVDDSDFRNKIKFPLTASMHYIIESVNGRINRANNISVFIHNQRSPSDFLKINIPSFPNIFNQLICNPVIDGKVIYTENQYTEPHDSSNKLSAFIKTFKCNFGTIDKFFTDSFWVGLFEYLSKNEKVAGDSISFNEIKQRATKALREIGIEVGLKDDTHLNEENLEFGLQDTLKELCDYRVFLKGFSLKCDNCASRFWYSINEVTDKIICKGCLEKIDLPIEPKFNYKLNDLIKNNIYDTRNDRSGNLTVIRTLANVYENSSNSFRYSPQLNVFGDPDSNKPSNELDIVCISDGKLIIGEAKHNSVGFKDDNNKSLKSLVEISKIIYPDKIILSCYEDSHGKLVNAKKSLIRLFNKWEHQPEIETLLLKAPNNDNIKEGYGYFRYFPNIPFDFKIES